MDKTLVLVTNQFESARIIESAREAADQHNTELLVVEIQNQEYVLDPKAVDYLFNTSRKNRATMRMIFTDHKIRALREIISQRNIKYIFTGMPGSNESIVYMLWKMFPDKSFFAVDTNGEVVEVSTSVQYCVI